MTSELNTSPKSKYDLSGYIASGKPVIRQAGNTTYSIQYYQGKHQFEYSIMELQGGIPNGQAQLFEDGIIKMMWTMENGIPSGLLTVFKQGVAERQTTWDFLDNPKETRWIVNEKNQVVMMIIDVRTNNTVYIGNYNSMWMKDGYGIECDGVTGNPIVSGYFHEDLLIHIHQRFYTAEDNRQLMTEYAGETDENNEELLSRKPVYVGEYIYDKKEYVFKRHGFGRAINWYSGFCDYESQWEYGKELRENRVQLSKGWYGEGVLDDSIRSFLLSAQERIDMIEEEERRKNAEKEEIGKEENETETEMNAEEQDAQLVSFIEEKFGQLKEELAMSDKVHELKRREEESMLLQTLQQGFSSIQQANITSSVQSPTIMSEVNLLSDWKVPQTIEIINVPQWSYSDRRTTMLAISGFPRLQIIQIGEHSFIHVKTLTITNLPILTRIEIGDDSFTDSLKNNPSSNGSFGITNCPSLVSISIGHFSFFNYSLLVLSGLDCLTTLSIGRNCFFNTEVLSFKSSFLYLFHTYQ